MKVLDIDMDFFLDRVTMDNHDENRYPDENCEVWDKKEIIDYLENILNLSKDNKIQGKIIMYHNESLDFWNDMINKCQLKTPFTIIHIDSHSDLDYYQKLDNALLDNAGYDKVLKLPYKERYSVIYGKNSKDKHDRWLNEGNYLLFAFGFRWIKELIYYTNIKEKYNDDDYDDKYIWNISDKNGIFIKKWKQDEGYESKITIITKKCKSKKFCNYDFITFSISPKYTPKKADFIVDIIKEYIEEL